MKEFQDFCKRIQVQVTFKDQLLVTKKYTFVLQQEILSYKHEVSKCPLKT